jgi:hypothetical protein
MNPGPSGEDAERGRSTSRCRITPALVRARSTSGLYLNSPDTKPICSTGAHAAHRVP